MRGGRGGAAAFFLYFRPGGRSPQPRLPPRRPRRTGQPKYKRVAQKTNGGWRGARRRNSRGKQRVRPSRSLSGSRTPFLQDSRRSVFLDELSAPAAGPCPASSPARRHTRSNRRREGSDCGPVPVSAPWRRQRRPRTAKHGVERGMARRPGSGAGGWRPTRTDGAEAPNFPGRTAPRPALTAASTASHRAQLEKMAAKRHSC